MKRMNTILSPRGTPSRTATNLPTRASGESNNLQIPHVVGLIAVYGLLVVVTALPALAADQNMGTAFNYQGFLQNPLPVTDSCNFGFILWDGPGPTALPKGPALSPPSVSVIDGHFNVNIDFGSDAINGRDRWLEIAVCCPNPCTPGPPLVPRIQLTPAPHALALPGLYTQQNDTSPNLISGYSGNIVAVGVGKVGQTIGGGGLGILPNEVTDGFGTVSGGAGNKAGYNSTVGGGSFNIATASLATVGGGTNNSANNLASTIAGGQYNTASGDSSTVGGGNTNSANNVTSTVGGGRQNTASGDTSTIGGGESNTASQPHATVSGGYGNDASGILSAIGGGENNTGSGLHATVGGGNLNWATGTHATVPGGSGNRAGGDDSFAAGYVAQAIHNGAFVWADSTGLPFSSTAANQFLIRAAGGVGIGTNAPARLLDIEGTQGQARLTSTNQTFGSVLELRNNTASPTPSYLGAVNFVDANNQAAGQIAYGGPSSNAMTFQTNSTDRMIITDGGNVGINTPSPSSRLVIADANATFAIDGSATTSGYVSRFLMDDTGLSIGHNSSIRNIEFETASTPRMTIHANGNVGIGTTNPTVKLRVEGDICYTGISGLCSDARYKRNIKPVRDALEMVSRTRPVHFDWRREEFPDRAFSDQRQIGFIAQELKEVAPEVVAQGSDGYYSVDYGRLTPLLTQAILDLRQEKNAEIEALRQVSSDLASRVAVLERSVSELCSLSNKQGNSPIAAAAMPLVALIGLGGLMTLSRSRKGGAR